MMSLLKWLLILSYFTVLIYVVFFARRRKELIWHADIVHVIPFKNTVNSFYALQNHTIKARLLFFFSNFFGNIFLLVPFPMVIAECFKVTSRRVLITLGALVSLLIELLQFFWRIGVPDIDDILLNTTGVAAGVFLWKNYVKRNERKGKIKA